MLNPYPFSTPKRAACAAPVGRPALADPVTTGLGPYPGGTQRHGAHPWGAITCCVTKQAASCSVLDSESAGAVSNGFLRGSAGLPDETFCLAAPNRVAENQRAAARAQDPI